MVQWFLIYQKLRFDSLVWARIELDIKSGGWYWLVLPTQAINPHILKEFITTNDYILECKFPEAKITSKVGRPRIGLRWF